MEVGNEPVGVPQVVAEFGLTAAQAGQASGERFRLGLPGGQGLFGRAGPLLGSLQFLLGLAPVVAVPGPLELLQVAGDPLVLLKAGHLLFQPLQARGDFAEEVAHPLQVALRLIQLGGRFLPPGTVNCDTGGFLKEGAPLLGLEGEGHIHQPLADDGVGALGQTAFGQEVHQVPQADAVAVEQVLTFAGAVGAPPEGHFGEIQGEPAIAVIQGEEDLGHSCAGPTAAAGENHVLGGLAAQEAQALLAQGPADGVGDVGFAGPVGADNGRDAGREDKLRPVGEGFIALKFQTLEAHLRVDE